MMVSSLRKISGYVFVGIFCVYGTMWCVLDDCPVGKCGPPTFIYLFSGGLQLSRPRNKIIREKFLVTVALRLDEWTQQRRLRYAEAMRVDATAACTPTQSAGKTQRVDPEKVIR